LKKLKEQCSFKENKDEEVGGTKIYNEEQIKDKNRGN
jgi:hypothetical protein